MATITSLDFERDTLKLFCRCNPTIMIPKIHSQLQSKLFRKMPINLGKIKNMQVFIANIIYDFKKCMHGFQLYCLENYELKC